MSRIVDEPYFTYIVHTTPSTSGIQVKCPKCHGEGVVTADDDNAYFRCLSCGHQKTRDRTIYRYDVHNQCKTAADTTGWILKMRKGSTFPFSMACPYCGTNPCREKFIKQRRHFHILAKSGMGENLISAWNCGFDLLPGVSRSGPSTGNTFAYLICYLSADLRKSHRVARKDSRPIISHIHENRKEPGADREAAEEAAREMRKTIWLYKIRK